MDLLRDSLIETIRESLRKSIGSRFFRTSKNICSTFFELRTSAVINFSLKRAVFSKKYHGSKIRSYNYFELRKFEVQTKCELRIRPKNSKFNLKNSKFKLKSSKFKEFEPQNSKFKVRSSTPLC